MKICYISPMTAAEGYGIFTHTIEVVTPLSKTVDELHLVTLECPEVDPAIIVHRLGKPPFTFLTNIYCMITTFFFLLRFLKKKKIDVIYTRNITTTFAACIAGKICHVPVVHEVNASPEERRYIKKGGLQLNDVLFPFFYKFNVKNTHHLTVVTANIKDMLLARYKIDPSRITVVSNGVNTELFQPMPITGARTKLNLDQDAQYVCFVGGLVLWQGLNNLIECAPYVLGKHPGTRFLIIGNGPMKEDLIKLATNKSVLNSFIFVGDVPYKEVPFYVNASDICVAPFIRARNEQAGISPLKIYEYASCAKPIVTSRLPGLEFIEEKDAGILAAPDDPQELASAISKLLQNAESRKRCGEHGRAYVVENHSWKIAVKKVAAVCENTVREYQK